MECVGHDDGECSVLMKRQDHMMLRPGAQKVAKAIFWIIALCLSSLGVIVLQSLILTQVPTWAAYIIWSVTLGAMFVLVASAVLLMPFWVVIHYRKDLIRNSRKCAPN